MNGQIHQTSRRDAAEDSECNMASTGVAPMPALSKTTGPSPDRRIKPPRGALTSKLSPACAWAIYPLRQSVAPASIGQQEMTVVGVGGAAR
jgi:hypothetical protein